MGERKNLDGAEAGTACRAPTGNKKTMLCRHKERGEKKEKAT
jgi:hypothetical protein